MQKRQKPDLLGGCKEAEKPDLLGGCKEAETRPVGRVQRGRKTRPVGRVQKRQKPDLLGGCKRGRNPTCWEGAKGAKRQKGARNMTDFDWDDNDGPLAYLITFRTYGTWLHGDDRYSVDRHGKNIYGTSRVLPSRNLNAAMRENQASASFLLDGPCRGVVERAIREVCSLRGYPLHAINIRTNHAHSVVASARKPEIVMNAFKSNATKELRRAGLVSVEQQVWARGGSTRYLWKPNHVESAIEYVLNGQGDDLPNF